jgi:hypothetical protein
MLWLGMEEVLNSTAVNNTCRCYSMISSHLRLSVSTRLPSAPPYPTCCGWRITRDQQQDILSPAPECVYQSTLCFAIPHIARGSS